MNLKKDQSKEPSSKTLPAKAQGVVAKSSKTQEYVKKNFKNNWSNTKSVYTRPR